MFSVEKATAKFWSRVNKDGAMAAHMDTRCWLWTGSRLNNTKLLVNKRYGLATFRGRDWLAHRLAWLLYTGVNPDKLDVLHKCDAPLCVRQDHLYLGTQADNNADRDRRGRHISLCGTAHGRAKLTDEQVACIRQEHIPYIVTPGALAEKYGVSRAAIRMILEGHNWRNPSGRQSSLSSSGDCVNDLLSVLPDQNE
jgi:hypothetical protein